MTVLFVCTGNTCRSPMAAALFRFVCEREHTPVSVWSAGLAADGSAASAHAVTVMAEKGLDIAAHRSQPVTADLCEQADLIVAMSPQHLAVLAVAFHVPMIKLRLMGNGIPDPFGGTEEHYRLTAAALLAACEDLHRVLVSPVSVVPMAAEHVASLAELEQLCFADPWSEAGLSEELTNPCAVFFVALAIDGSVAGYVGMHKAADEGAIDNVAVHPAFRKRGVGKALVQSLIAHAKANGLAQITLEVRASNKAAIHLYETEGFTLWGKRNGFYNHPKEDALIYGWKG